MWRGEIFDNYTEFSAVISPRRLVFTDEFMAD